MQDEATQAARKHEADDVGQPRGRRAGKACRLSPAAGRLHPERTRAGRTRRCRHRPRLCRLQPIRHWQAAAECLDQILEARDVAASSTSAVAAESLWPLAAATRGALEPGQALTGPRGRPRGRSANTGGASLEPARPARKPPGQRQAAGGLGAPDRAQALRRPGGVENGRERAGPAGERRRRCGQDGVARDAAELRGRGEWTVATLADRLARSPSGRARCGRGGPATRPRRPAQLPGTGRQAMRPTAVASACRRVRPRPGHRHGRVRRSGGQVGGAPGPR